MPAERIKFMVHCISKQGHVVRQCIQAIHQCHYRFACNKLSTLIIRRSPKVGIHMNKKTDGPGSNQHMAHKTTHTLAKKT